MNFKKISIVLITALTLVLSSCDINQLMGIKPVITDFSADKTTIDQYSTVKFTVTGKTKDDMMSSSSTDYSGTVKLTVNGDEVGSATFESAVGKSGFSEEISVKFSEAGTFEVVATLTATGGENATATKTVSITVNELPKHTVTFEANGGSAVTAKEVAEGMTFSLPSSTKSGFTLEGWYTSSTFSDVTKWTNTTKVTSDIKLYANWTVYVAPGESIDNPITIKVDQYEKTISTFKSNQSIYYKFTFSNSLSSKLKIAKGDAYANETGNAKYYLYNSNKSIIKSGDLTNYISTPISIDATDGDYYLKLVSTSSSSVSDFNFTVRYGY